MLLQDVLKQEFDIQLEKSDLPPFPIDLDYLVIMGSRAYGVAKEDSDYDIYGFCIPPLSYLFPCLNGYVDGYPFNHTGDKKINFEQWQKTALFNPKDLEFDINVYNIAKYFDLCANCNPNMLDSLFVPEDCVVYQSPIGNYLRKNRRQFLSKHAFFKYNVYAKSQFQKIQGRDRTNPERKADIEEFGYSLKFAYHLVRLTLQCEEILDTGDLTLDANSQVLKDIRAGKWSYGKLEKFFNDYTVILEEKLEKSSLPKTVDYKEIYNIFVNCLTIKFGDLESLQLWKYQ